MFVTSIVFGEKTIFFTLHEVDFHIAMVLHELFDFHGVREVVICVSDVIDLFLTSGVKIYLSWFAELFELGRVLNVRCSVIVYFLNFLCSQS